MTTSQVLAGLAALAAVGWPHAKDAAVWATGFWQGLRKPHPPLPTPREEAVAPSYSAAIGSLASVRARLKATGCLKDAELKAIDTLTLALVAGSDK